MRLPHGRCAGCGRLFVIWLCVASALLGSACIGQTSSQNSVTVVAPAPVDGALSIFVEQPSQLVAFRARDGSTRWTYSPQSERFDTDHGLRYSSGLLLGFTYGADNLTLVAVDAANGHLRWHVRMEGLIAPLMAITSDYVVLVLGTRTSPGPLQVIRARDGAKVRDIPLASAGWIAADGDTAFVCTDDAVLTAFGLADGLSLWTVPVAPGLAESGHPCGLRAGDGIVFAQVTIFTPNGPQGRGGEVVAVRERDGHRLWQKPNVPALLKGGKGYSFVEPARSPGQPPAYSLVAYRTADGQVLWQIPTDSFEIAGDENVLVLHHLVGGLRAVRASDGASLWYYAPPPERYLVAEDVAGGLVFAMSMQTVFYRFGGPPPGTDVREHLLVLGAGNGRLYWQMPLDASEIAIGSAT